MRNLMTRATIALLLSSTAVLAADDVASNSKTGSFLIYASVELKWDAAGDLIQDTILDIINDGNEDVWVQLYFINGDPPLDAVFVGDPPVEIERAHPGCNWVDVQGPLTANQPMYWSAATGGPYGVPPFTVLDPGNPPGRPDPESPGDRVLRGLVLAWAVEVDGLERAYNHLKGDALVFNIRSQTAWEYGALAFAALNVVADGAVNLDGVEYDAAPDRLHLEFFAPGAIIDPLGIIVDDTDLTLLPVGFNLQQGGTPFTTKARCDIWNMNEFRLSGTERCITCWAQVRLTDFTNGGPGNNFLLENLGTNKGRARINGVAHAECGAEAMPILGLSAPALIFQEEGRRASRGGQSGTATTGVALGAEGAQTASIIWDIIEPPAAFEIVDFSTAGAEITRPAKPVLRSDR